MRNIIKLAMYAGMGLYDRVREIVEDLVKRGELKQQEGEELLAAAKEHESARAKRMQDSIESVIRSALDRMPRLASAKDIAALEERLRALESRLEPAATGHKPGGSPV